VRAVPAAAAQCSAKAPFGNAFLMIWAVSAGAAALGAWAGAPLSGDVGAGVGEVVADGRLGDPKRPTDAHGGQIPAVDEAVHGHL
jgi:hypothetical protein